MFQALTSDIKSINLFSMITDRNNMLRILILCLIIPMAAAVMSSCAVKNEISISTDGAGTATMAAELDENLVFYLQSMAELTDDAPADGRIFNTEEISAEIEKNPGLTVISITNDDDSSINGEVRYTNIEQLIAETEETLNRPIITFREYGAEKEISIYIDIDNFTDIAPLFPVVEEPLFMTFGPLENQGLSESEYLEMMEYALGDGGGRLIKESVIQTVIRVDGRIISQKGGRKESDSTVVFETPLIRLLLLDKPVEYSIRFR